ncbi:hypothetical protein I3V78_25090 [Archangium primigenium]|nr:hypothetical protein [Archangium primigenium]
MSLDSSIENDVAALAPLDDPRALAASDADSVFKCFSEQFSDAFGRKVEPSVLLLRADANRAFFDVGAVSSFRDAIAISAIGYSRALELIFPRGHRVLYGDALAFYPWTPSAGVASMVIRTPAYAGIDEVKRFHGQSSPVIPTMRLQGDHLDMHLLRELFSRWCRLYGSSSPRRDDVALFRSLNMAFHASLMPAGADETFYDRGRLISLWVSAFEILVHPGPGGSANKLSVFNLLEDFKWLNPKSAARTYETSYRRVIKRRTLASWLYEKIYECRCKFLHGEVVSPSDFNVPRPEGCLDEYAAPLYRMALAAFLPIVGDASVWVVDGDVQSVAALLDERISLERTQNEFEAALWTALPPEPQ